MEETSVEELWKRRVEDTYGQDVLYRRVNEMVDRDACL